VARPADSGERWVGLGVEAVGEALARTANLPRVEGLYVRSVDAGSPAARTGLRVGDVVLLAGGTYLSTAEGLPASFARAPLGSALELAVRRGGELMTLRVPVEESPPGRLLVFIRPLGVLLLDVAADGVGLWAYGTVPGREERGIVPIQMPGAPIPRFAPRAVASPGVERVIAADGERVYLGWAGSELYVDYYELVSGRVGRLAVRGAESLANRCRPLGLTRVGPEIWMACRRPEGPAVARIDLASGQARVDPLPPTYWGGLAFDGEAVLWLCCQGAGGLSLSRTELASGLAQVFPVPQPVVRVAADRGAVYLLGADGSGVFKHKPWR